MALRLIEIRISQKQEDQVENLLKDYPQQEISKDRIEEDRLYYRLILPAEKTETLTDQMQKAFHNVPSFQMVLMPVEAVFPRKETQEKEAAAPSPEQSEKAGPMRVSREELFHDISDASKLNAVYIVMVVLSAIVASIGISKNNIPAVIGAMMIAPLLGPNMALSLATTLGDLRLARTALKVNIAGVATAFSVALLIGAVFSDVLQMSVTFFRVDVGYEDIALAFAAGCAGALAFTTGVPTTLSGVMVAVALLPPAVTFGMLLGAGNTGLALKAGLLLLTNVICVNLAGVVTFHLQGVRPLTWWEEGRAKKARRIASVLWLALLLALCGLIYLSQQF